MKLSRFSLLRCIAGLEDNIKLALFKVQKKIPAEAQQICQAVLDLRTMYVN